VLGLSTTVFFGPLGVALAQILAYTPIAFLVLQGVVQALNVSLEEAAETLQILILTCHPERYRALEGAQFINLEEAGAR